MPTGQYNFTLTARWYKPGTSPDEKVTAKFIPVMILGDGSQIRCNCTWGCVHQGEMYLRFRNDACQVKKKGGHK